MVPVELRLSNFLSYGAEPQTLDFSQFHVACLSGKNGQGKSALLDAITWVLWGEGRKSSGGHKPDEELLRIGSRRMKVELLFDVEEVRYRVMRSFSRSATGKTSKSELEIQVLDTGASEGRPITRGSIRASQEALNEILGLDYHTFINSAFLLQGRSDEFTKKKPSERKDILGRILNLEKYDRLAAIARVRQRELNHALDVQKREAERLAVAIEPDKEWKAAFKEVEKALKEKQVELEGGRVGEAGLVEQIGAFEAQAKTAETLLAALTKMAEEVQLEKETLNQLESRIVAANELVQRKDEIERQVTEVVKLVEEREDLDSNREVYRGIEQQISQKKNELQEYRLEVQQKVHQLELELRVSRNAIEEIITKLEQKEKYERELNEAKAAQKRVETMQAKIVERDLLRDEISKLERHINGCKESITGQIKSLEDRKSSTSVASEGSTFVQERKKHESDVLLLERLNKELDRITQDGLKQAELVKTLEGASGALEKEGEKVETQLSQLQDISTSECPTCGNELTDSHRIEVVKKLEAQLSEISNQIDSNEKEILRGTEDRDRMREAFVETQKKAGQLAGAAEKIVLLGERLKAFELQQKENVEIVDKISELSKKLKSGIYAEEESARLSELQARMATLALPDKALEEDRFKANQIVRYEEHLRSMLLAEAQKEKHEAKIEALSVQVEEARKAIDEGDRILALKKEIQEKETRLASVGFDPVRFEAVRRRIKELSHAQDQFKDLLNAQQNLSDWEAQKEKVKSKIDQLGEEQVKHRERYEELSHLLEGKETLEGKLQEAQEFRRTIETESQELQVQSGELQAKLEQAKQNREALKVSRQSIKELKTEEGLYAKLKRAFGKHGIPSLIIEQSLPEIEERTNELLSRLTEGKMRVTLETLKDKKTGGTRETLEIIITGEQGAPRPYETFSGGEAFRVNFALRIALSQMLAERNGVRIRTLGIDEGFGTQDQEGIQNLIEALQVIQEDFDKIIVITHLDRLKEVFPVRIEVVKDPVDGSRFTLIKG